MTPEERAQKLMTKILSGISRPVAVRDVDITKWIAENIRAAVAQDREACAKLVEQMPCDAGCDNWLRITDALRGRP